MKRKRWVWRIGFACLLFFTVAVLWGITYRDELEQAWKSYRERETERSISRYGADLAPIDEIRLLRLAEDPQPQNRGTFSVSYSEPSKMFIVEDKVIRGAAAQEFASVWRSATIHTRNLAVCYSPHHVVQFRASGTCVCEAVICFMCGNTTLPAFPTRTLVSFKTLPPQESAEFLALKNAVEELIGKYDEPQSP